jgi:hypothetical protein
VATTQSPASASSQQAAHVAQQAAQQPQPTQQAQQAPPQKKKRVRNPFRRNPAKVEAKKKAKQKAHGEALAKGRTDMLGHGAITAPAAGAQPSHQATMPAAKAADKTEAGMGSDLAENFTVFSDPIDAVGGAVGDTGGYMGIRADYEDATPGHATEKPDDAKDATAEHQAAILGATSSGLGAATSGVSVAAGVAGAIDNFRQFAAMVKANKQTPGRINGLRMTDTFLQGTGNTLQVGTSGLGGAASLGGMGAGIASAHDATNDAAATAASAFDGLGDAIGAVGGSVQLLVSGARLVIGTINNIRNPDEANWSATATDSIGMLKGFLSTANSTVSAVSGFLQIAGHAANLANALPLVGAAVNICIQFLDIAIQAINFVKALVKMIKAIQQSRKMKGASAKAAAGSKDQQMLDHLAEVNTKRYKRQLLPLISSVVNGVADCISIGGSVLNIVGVATSPAYGAGVAIMAAGYGASATAGLVKLGTALAGPVQRFVRSQKQFGRDVAAGEKTGKRATALKKMHLVGAYNADKSSGNKDQRYLASVNSIFDMVAALPDQYTPNDSAKFEHAHDVIKATGVSTKRLYAATDQEAATRLLMEALKKRE